MTLRERQAKEYLAEAERTLLAAEVLYRAHFGLWVQVVTSSYDAMEQAVSAAIAAKEQDIPREHAEKIKEFVRLCGPPPALLNVLTSWVSRRSASRYVDVRGESLVVPRTLFSERDAQRALGDAHAILAYVKGLLP